MPAFLQGQAQGPAAPLDVPSIPLLTLMTALPSWPEPQGGLAEAGSGGPLYPSIHLLPLASGGGVPN